MVEGFYSLGVLRAKPGKEGELLAAWQALCDGFAQLDHPPEGSVTLVQSTTEPSLHYFICTLAHSGRFPGDME